MENRICMNIQVGQMAFEPPKKSAKDWISNRNLFARLSWDSVGDSVYRVYVSDLDSDEWKLVHGGEECHAIVRGLAPLTQVSQRAQFRIVASSLHADRIVMDEVEHKFVLPPSLAVFDQAPGPPVRETKPSRQPHRPGERDKNKFKKKYGSYIPQRYKSVGPRSDGNAWNQSAEQKQLQILEKRIQCTDIKLSRKIGDIMKTQAGLAKKHVNSIVWLEGEFPELKDLVVSTKRDVTGLDLKTSDTRQATSVISKIQPTIDRRKLSVLPRTHYRGLSHPTPWRDIPQQGTDRRCSRVIVIHCRDTFDKDDNDSAIRLFNNGEPPSPGKAVRRPTDPKGERIVKTRVVSSKKNDDSEDKDTTGKTKKEETQIPKECVEEEPNKPRKPSTAKSRKPRAGVATWLMEEFGAQGSSTPAPESRRNVETLNNT